MGKGRAGAVICGLAVFYTTSRCFSEEGAEDGGFLDELLKLAKPQDNPHSVRISGTRVGMEAISQGPEQWQLTVQEAGSGNRRPAFFVNRHGGKANYGFEYDSTQSSYGPPEGPVKRVALSAAGRQGDNGFWDRLGQIFSSDYVWTMKVEGDKGRHISVTGDEDNVVYDASYTAEVPVGEDLTLLYAIDAKKQAFTDGLFPNWVQNGLGLRYSSSHGDLKVNMHQPNEGAMPEYSAVFTNKVPGFWNKLWRVVMEQPEYTLRAGKIEGQPGQYSGHLRVPGHKGFTYGLHVGMKDDSEPEVKATVGWSGKKEVANGIELDADTGVWANAKEIDLLPIGTGVAMDLATMMPGTFADGSKVSLRGRWKTINTDSSLEIGKPHLAATMHLNSKHSSDLKASASATMTEDGTVSSKASFSGYIPGGAHMRYELTHGKDGLTQAGELIGVPQEAPFGLTGRGTARFYQGKEHGGKPRLQLGMEYSGTMDVAGKEITLSGTSQGYDSGRTLLDEMGKPWTSPQLTRARNMAAVVRKRIEGEIGEGKRWLMK